MFQTSSRLFILAIPFQPGTSHTLPSGTLSGFIPTVLARSRNLSGSPDVAEAPEDCAPDSVPSSSRGERRKWEELLERILKVFISKFYSMDRQILSASVKTSCGRFENNMLWQVANARIILVCPFYSSFCLSVQPLKFQLVSLNL